MASFTATSITMLITSLSSSSSQTQTLVPCTRFSNHNSVSLSTKGRTLPSITLQPRVGGFQVTCKVSLGQAKQETVKKVCDIVKQQMALPEESTVTGETKFAALGPDSLDMVVIVTEIEKEFGISVEVEGARSITSIQEAADMIEKLIENKSD